MCVACSTFVCVTVVIGCSLMQHQCLGTKNTMFERTTVVRDLRRIAGSTALIGSQCRLNGCRQIGQFSLGKILTRTIGELPRRESHRTCRQSVQQRTSNETALTATSAKRQKHTIDFSMVLCSVSRREWSSLFYFVAYTDSHPPSRRRLSSVLPHLLVVPRSVGRTSKCFLFFAVGRSIVVRNEGWPRHVEVFRNYRRRTKIHDVLVLVRFYSLFLNFGVRRARHNV